LRIGSNYAILFAGAYDTEMLDKQSNRLFFAGQKERLTMVSIVVPIYNEEKIIRELLEGIKKSFHSQNIPFEILFVDDGSNDGSWSIIETLSRENKEVRGLKLAGNVGQHNALMAGFEHTQGDFIITLDADMQDSPGNLPRIYKQLCSGYDIVGGKRKTRKDSLLRKMLSFLMHFTIRYFTRLNVASTHEFTDYGCMLRGYRKWVIEKLLETGGKSVYIPTFTSLIGGKFCEIEIEHGSRKQGKSKYGIRNLLSLYFDMITDISLFPVQIISYSGIVLSFVGFALGLVIFIRRIFIGPEVEGVFTLFAFLFIFTGVLLVAVGLIGEYIGRIYREVNKSPRYVIREKLGYRKPLRIGFFGYSEVGYTCLEKLIQMGEDVVFVVTHRDQKDERIWFRSVSDLAHRNLIPVLKPENILDKRFTARISSFKPDVVLSVYFRNIFGRELLTIPPSGCINLHGSLLPSHRGRAPVNWAIIHGEKETGITLHYMTEKVDAGSIIMQKKIAIESTDTGFSLTKKIASEGAELLRKCIDILHREKPKATPQDESKASYFGKRTPEMGRIDWKWNAETIYNYVRSLTDPFPGAYFMLRERKCVILRGEISECVQSADAQSEWKIASKDEAMLKGIIAPGTIVKVGKGSIMVMTREACFNILEVSLDGKRLSGNEFASLYRLSAGDRLEG